eukprot:CAMPEP_0195283752 /NCGR_PEP_ID=MMETSP0707-20130614/2196_1 /TAXON_ID=33640 /ORGANISM="Asterionellopsis glacialis, Strain CCMP134" /LENGTH=417 /DNA_ID=CAMNT_0040342979 /DNA_START=158 /DNA_END=1411 /DNA_ORIENTATION=+
MVTGEGMLMKKEEQGSSEVLKVHYNTADVIDSEKEYSPFRMSERIEPTENDILMGRGGKNNQHIGNEKLRDLARGRCEDYRMSSKKGKSYISRELVQRVREMIPPGRFLKKDSASGLWEDVGDEVAREKASQALRDAVSQKYDGPGSVSPQQMRPKEQASIPRPQLHRRTSSDPGVSGEHSSDSRKARMQEWREETMIRPSVSDPPQPQSHHSSRSHSTPVYSSDYAAVTPAQGVEYHSTKRRRYFSESSVNPSHRPAGRQYDYQQTERNDPHGRHEYREHQEWAHYGRPENYDRHNDRHYYAPYEHQERPPLPVTASPVQVSSSHYYHSHQQGRHGAATEHSTQHMRHRYPIQQANPRQGSGNPRQGNTFDSPGGILSELHQGELSDFDLFNGELLDENGEPVAREDETAHRNTSV